MGADRKGPLAAFVVIAIIAAILLVTSVRSQAEPLLTAAPPAVTAPDLWGSVSDDVQQVVEAGVSLVRKATADPTRASDPSLTSAATSGTRSAPRPVSAPVTRAVTGVAPSVRPRVHRHAHRTTHRASHRVAPRATPRPAPVAVHGRHLGWAKAGHGHGRHLGWAKHGS